MIIDCHVHTFPEKISKKALENLSEKSGLPYYTDGSLEDTMSKMKKWGVDGIIALNIATNPKQQKNVNDYAISIQGERVFSFGSIHPDAEDAVDELERLKEHGIRGIKLHPEYQAFRMNEEKMYPIYQKCMELGLRISFHGGYDIGYPISDRCLPKDAANMARNFPGLKFNLAHMGAWENWDAAEAELMGIDNLYLDTSFVANYLKPEQMKRLIQKHGADHILFGSDCPWEPAEVSMAFLKKLELPAGELDFILEKNAVCFLGL